MVICCQLSQLAKTDFSTEVWIVFRCAQSILTDFPGDEGWP
jgi:hypothetical protein